MLRKARGAARPPVEAWEALVPAEPTRDASAIARRPWRSRCSRRSPDGATAESGRLPERSAPDCAARIRATGSRIAAVEGAELLHEPAPGLASRVGRRSSRRRSRDTPPRAPLFRAAAFEAAWRGSASSITAAWARLKPAAGACDTAAAQPHAEARALRHPRRRSRPPAPNARARRRASAPGRRSATVGQSRRPVRQPAKMRTSSTWLAHRVRHLAQIVERARRAGTGR